jgi:hypothetical protein
LVQKFLSPQKIKNIPVEYGSIYVKHPKKDLPTKYVYYKGFGEKKQILLGNTRESFPELEEKILMEDRRTLGRRLKSVLTPLGDYLDLFEEEVTRRFQTGRYRRKTYETYLGRVRVYRRIYSLTLSKGMKKVDGTDHQSHLKFISRFCEPLWRYHFDPEYREEMYQRDKKSHGLKRGRNSTKERHSKETILGFMRTMGTFFVWMSEEGFLNRDPWKETGRPWMRSKIQENYSQQTVETSFGSGEVEREKYESFKTLRKFYLDGVTAKNPFNPFGPNSHIGHTIFFLQILTGCRIREITNSVWSGRLLEVLEAGKITDTISQFSPDLLKLEISDKSSKKRGGSRTVDIPEDGRKLLETRFESHWDDNSPWVFHTSRSRNNRPVTQVNLLHFFKMFQGFGDKRSLNNPLSHYFSDDPPVGHSTSTSGTLINKRTEYIQSLKDEGFTYPRRLVTHDLRSYFITDLLNHRPPDDSGFLQEISLYVGHSSTSTTLNHYISLPNLTHSTIRNVLQTSLEGL